MDHVSTSRRSEPSDGDVPRISIQYCGPKPATVEYIEYGIEEEGVPWRSRSIADEPPSGRTATEVAYRAASDSGLKIGIGIAPDGTHTIHHARLPPEDPIANVTPTTNAQARTIGTNAARLAKRMPLEPIE
ncbi:glycerol dehydratase reactivase beta/small subunit family protein [Halalkalicoccus paucihalophilus]|uniref:glycerol dehydratase reactivase beta/small subunit family protein n=1 Tax=Halalkalicoccus paucihalophilus TaxID=1008153 RepID=UPI00082FC67E|nr:glycerol dehydratase reactivase beta/small subunit family protein [Halalkalicoccus paucihalophilus]